MNFQDLFDVKRIFALQPPVNFRYGDTLNILYLVLTVAMLVLMLMVHFTRFPDALKNRKKQIFKTLRAFIFTFLIGFVLVWTRGQYIAFFSMRFFLMLLICTQLAMVIYFVWEWVVAFPRFEQKVVETIMKNRYLPKRKKR